MDTDIKLNYIQHGDILLPDLTTRDQPKRMLTKLGVIRKKYLEDQRPYFYNDLIIRGQLFTHCLEVEELALERMDLIIKQMAEAEGVTEALKRSDMMKWVQMMNSFEAQAEEIVLAEIVCK